MLVAEVQAVFTRRDRFGDGDKLGSASTAELGSAIVKRSALVAPGL
jgi:hypothetical protein